MKIANIIEKDYVLQGCLTKDVIPLFYKSILHPAGRSDVFESGSEPCLSHGEPQDHYGHS